MGKPLEDVRPATWQRELNEEGIRQVLAYCQARLVDIDKAPPYSRHREGRQQILHHIRECEALLDRLRNLRPSATRVRPRMTSRRH